VNEVARSDRGEQTCTVLGRRGLLVEDQVGELCVLRQHGQYGEQVLVVERCEDPEGLALVADAGNRIRAAERVLDGVDDALYVVESRFLTCDGEHRTRGCRRDATVGLCLEGAITRHAQDAVQRSRGAALLGHVRQLVRQQASALRTVGRVPSRVEDDVLADRVRGGVDPPGGLRSALSSVDLDGREVAKARLERSPRVWVEWSTLLLDRLADRGRCFSAGAVGACAAARAVAVEPVDEISGCLRRPLNDAQRCAASISRRRDLGYAFCERRHLRPFVRTAVATKCDAGLGSSQACGYAMTVRRLRRIR
jgi:hypothetical protein